MSSSKRKTKTPKKIVEADELPPKKSSISRSVLEAAKILTERKKTKIGTTRSASKILKTPGRESNVLNSSKKSMLKSRKPIGSTRKSTRKSSIVRKPTNLNTTNLNTTKRSQDNRGKNKNKRQDKNLDKGLDKSSNENSEQLINDQNSNNFVTKLKEIEESIYCYNEMNQRHDLAIRFLEGIIDKILSVLQLLLEIFPNQPEKTDHSASTQPPNLEIINELDSNQAESNMEVDEASLIINTRRKALPDRSLSTIKKRIKVDMPKDPLIKPIRRINFINSGITPKNLSDYALKPTSNLRPRPAKSSNDQQLMDSLEIQDPNSQTEPIVKDCLANKAQDLIRKANLIIQRTCLALKKNQLKIDEDDQLKINEDNQLNKTKNFVIKLKRVEVCPLCKLRLGPPYNHICSK